MEPTAKDNGTSSQQEVNSISVSEVMEQLFAIIPLKAFCQDMTSLQLPTFIEGLKRFHAQEYHKAIAYFQTASELQRNNLILFTLSFTYCLIDECNLARTYADQIDTTYFGPGITPDTTDLDNLYLFIEKSELPDLQTNGRDWITEKDKLRYYHQEAISEHQELLIVKKALIQTILRDLEPAEARHILNEIRRKFENDEIHEEFFTEDK